MIEQGWSDVAAGQYFYNRFGSDKIMLRCVDAQVDTMAVHIYHADHTGRAEWRSADKKLLKRFFSTVMLDACQLNGELHAGLIGKARRNAPPPRVAQGRAAYDPILVATKALAKFRRRAVANASGAAIIVLHCCYCEQHRRSTRWNMDFDTGDAERLNLHFQNGVLDVETKAFRARTHCDHVTKWLPYDFIPLREVDPGAMEFVRTIYRKIHPDPEQMRFALAILAYCLTGVDVVEKVKFNYGASAANGKSTELQIHNACLPTYTHVLPVATLTHAMAQRQLDVIGNGPIRLAYADGIPANQLGGVLLKDIHYDIMFATTIRGDLKRFRHGCKFVVASNQPPGTLQVQFDTRKTKQRLVCQGYWSQFVQGATDDTETHVYAREEDMLGHFTTGPQSDQYKMAYIFLLLENWEATPFTPSSAYTRYPAVAHGAQ